MKEASNERLATSVDDVNAPLLHRGKVREVFDLGEHLLLVVTDRISAHDLQLMPPIPQKGAVLNRLSEYWFSQTADLQDNHFVHADVDKLVADGIIDASKASIYEHRVTVGRKADRIDIECVVRGHLTGGGWRQYQKNGEVNGVVLPDDVRKNQQLEQFLFTPAVKNEVGHDEDISFFETARMVGRETAEAIRVASLRLYTFARAACRAKGIILADCKLEFGRINGELVLIDECFTPDSSRFWAQEDFELDVEIDSMDKEPLRQFLLGEEKATGQMPTTLPEEIVLETSERYLKLFRRITGLPQPAGVSGVDQG